MLKGFLREVLIVIFLCFLFVAIVASLIIGLFATLFIALLVGPEKFFTWGLIICSLLIPFAGYLTALAWQDDSDEEDEQINLPSAVVTDAVQTP